MKKIVLLFTMLCVTVLVSMESEKGNLGAFEQLPVELRQEISQTALTASTTVDEAIKAIQNASAIYGGVKLDRAAAMDLLKNTLPNDLNQAIKAAKHLQGSEPKDFTKLVHLLADKFHESPYDVASLFKTPIAQKYLKLANQLEELAYQYNDNPEELKNPIAQGADVNFYGGSYKQTPLNNAIWAARLNKVGILLAAGANPFVKDAESNTAFDQVLMGIEQEKKLQSQGYPGNTETLRKLEAIKALLEEYAKKYQQNLV